MPVGEIDILSWSFGIGAGNYDSATFDGNFIVSNVTHELEINFTGSPTPAIGQALFFPILNNDLSSDFDSFTLTRTFDNEFELTADGESTVLSNPTIHDLQLAVGEILGVDRSNSGHPDGNHEQPQELDTSNLPTINAGAPEGVDGAYVVSGPISSFFNGDDAFNFADPVIDALKDLTEHDPSIADGYWVLLTPLPPGATNDGHAVFMGLTGRLDFKDDVVAAIEDNGGEFRDLPAVQASINALTNEWTFISPNHDVLL